MKPRTLVVVTLIAAGVFASSCAVSFPDFQQLKGDGGASSSSATTASGSTGGAGPGTGGTTSTGGGGGGPGAGGSAGGGGAPVVANCTDYCNTIMNNCTVENKEYITSDTCLAMCKQMVLGHVGDTKGDTIGCRLTYANMAAGHQVDYCQQAGPVGGEGPCSHDPCGTFCSEVDTTCAESSPWAGDIPGCISTCKTWAYILTRSSGEVADAGAGVGDLYQNDPGTLNCRIYHLEAANNTADPAMPAMHCMYHLPSGGPCGP